MESKVKVISSDNKVFVLDYDVSIQSQTLRTFFSRPEMFLESISREVKLPVKSRHLKRIVEFLEFKYLSDSDKEPKEFKVSDSEALELLDIAVYLKI
ncbi:Skp1-like protein [Encephalitozoon intestinalis ATCC 50506]|uniref:Elongin-C n=1 Tax=Encephalitozoon intestinalis (strain ATCC 50506) TaxID=876142 RepID=W8Q1U6_ENCIT|nr:Skp1-like protein [Encephalitozoon intestinalis ATCC 50506]AHL30094.1 Skp1-like protein [Encephalitozoon intestinalis ATCC 50506]UTX45124.1 elongin C [Encephalitozoon intestinalis]